MPFAVDSSLALRPDPGVRAREAEPAATPAEQQAFADELERARRAEPVQPARSQGTPTLVAARRTQLSGSEAAEALKSAWTQVRGEAPSQETLSILVGQWAHETGRGQSMLNFNFGGIKGTGPSGMSAAYGTREGWGENATRVVARFRAYGSAEEGARDYVSLLARRYPNAVSAAEAGDARGFVQALKTNGYFTDNLASYTRSVESLAARARLSGFDALGSASSGRAVPGAAGAGLAEALLAGVDPDAAAAGLGGAGLGGADLTEAGLAEALLAGASGNDPRLASALPLRGDLPLRGHLPLRGDLPLSGDPRLAVPDASQDPRAGLAVAPSAFADEVNRAALLMSALRIAEPGSRRG